MTLPVKSAVRPEEPLRRPVLSQENFQLLVFFYWELLLGSAWETG